MDWSNFADYETKMDNVTGNYQMIALCTYCLNRFDTAKIIEVTVNHRFVLIKREGKLKQIKNLRCERDEEKIRNLANIVEFSNDAILTIALDGTITSWNKGAEQNLWLFS